MNKGRLIPLIAGAIALLVVAGVASAGHKSPPKPQRFLAGPFCVAKKTGAIRSIKARQRCHRGEIRNRGVRVKGARGIRGPQGPVGPRGASGATGPQGASGPVGPAGISGTQVVTVTSQGSAGQKTTTAVCPAGDFALSGGFSAQGSVTQSYRSDANGDPAGNTGWTASQSSGNTGSLTVYVYCVVNAL